MPFIKAVCLIAFFGIVNAQIAGIGNCSEVKGQAGLNTTEARKRERRNKNIGK
jgi:hypothetical protein